MWKNKKIILVFPYFYPHAGACANRGRSFYKYLSKKFFTKVICQNNKKGNQKDVYKINQKNFFCRWRHFNKIISSEKPNYLVISIPSIIYSFSLFFLFQKTKIILDVRDINGNFKKFKNIIIFFLEKYAFKKSTHILVTTEKQKIIIEKKYKISSEKIFIIENGVDLEQIKLNPKKQKKYDLVFLGSINPERDPEKLYKLLKELENFKIKIIGWNSKTIESKIQKKIKKLKHVKIIPEVYFEKAIKELEDCKLGLLTQNHDPRFFCQLPVKIFEYISVGLPIIFLGPAEAYASEFIKKNELGLCHWKVMTAKKNIIKLLTNKNSYLFYKKNAQQVIKKYDRKKLIKKLIKLIEKDV